MPYLNRVVCGLNEQLIKEAFSFTTGGIKAYGLAETVIEQVDEVTVKRFPAAIDENGEATPIDVDDTYSIIVYHRLEGIVNNTERTVMGRGQGNIVETANMALICFAFRDKVKCTADVLEAAIKDKMPDVRGELRNEAGALIQTSVFRIGNSSFDKITLLGREYSSFPFIPEHIAFELKYRIESTWQKGCLSICT